VFFAEATPSAAVNPSLIAFNEDLASELGIERGAATDAELAEVFSGARLPAGAQPIATVYAGHQFGHPVARLGDGRALLLGEVVGRDGRRRDIQLKGSGRTPYSRGGDGLSPLGPVLREYLVSEAMHSLGIPTTRALAAVTTGGVALRQGPLPGAVFTRVASSHLRVGTFEFFARRGDREELQTLLDYAIQRHDPDLADEEDQALEFFLRVAHRFVSLVAQWWGVGFIHGVMNTDNTSISGETIDFGPCAFMDTFEFGKVFSSIDRQGRYRFENQAPVAIWNLSVLANCLVPLVDEDEARGAAKLEEALSHFDSWFRARWLAVMAAKLGIRKPEASDRALVEAYLQRLQEERLDYTLAFRGLSRELDLAGSFHDRWRARLEREGRPRSEVVAQMNSVNPVIIPRNHQIEEAIVEAREGNYERFHALGAALRAPFEDRPELEPFKAPPEPDEVVRATFCGT
jgi:serine/tyrosine/threonine adenylyltransferase